jgi:hypothetical protein
VRNDWARIAVMTLAFWALSLGQAFREGQSRGVSLRGDDSFLLYYIRQTWPTIHEVKMRITSWAGIHFQHGGPSAKTRHGLLESPVSISRPKKVHGLASERLDQALNDTRRNQGFKSDPTLYTIAPKFYDDMFETLWGSSSI